MQLTKTTLDKLAAPLNKPQAFFRDDSVRGFAVRVTASGTKSFIFEKSINNKVKRITLGRCDELSLDQARKMASSLLGQIAAGADPILERQTQALQATTLGQAYAAYLKARKGLKPKTLYLYERLMEGVLAALKHRPLVSITKDYVSELHSHIGQQHGKAQANAALTLVRALFNFAAGHYEDTQGRPLVMDNPIKRLSQTRAWYKIERRKTYIKQHELAIWFTSILQLTDETMRDYLLLVLFTGLRKNEAAQIKWQQIDFNAKTLTLGDTKNNNAHVLPLSDYLSQLLQKRHDHKTGAFVFPGRAGVRHVTDPNKAKGKASIMEATGINFTVHDLRRTFITIADSLDISAYAIKRLVNHKMKNDVTAGYIITDVERLRKPMQQITDFLLSQVKV